MKVSTSTVAQPCTPAFGAAGRPAYLLPGPAVDDATGVEARRDKGDRGASDALDLLDEHDGRLRQLLEAARLLVLLVEVVRKRQRDVGGPVEVGAASQEFPVEFGDATELAAD